MSLIAYILIKCIDIPKSTMNIRCSLLFFCCFTVIYYLHRLTLLLLLFHLPLLPIAALKTGEDVSRRVDWRVESSLLEVLHEKVDLRIVG